MDQTITKNSQMLSLDKVQTDTVTCIENLTGGREFISRASGRGFTPGTRLKVVQNFKIGPLIVYLRNTQIALGRGEAKKILVKGMEA
ncbi:MAG: ferrous iron transport protein A [Desulfobacteraceae bacterium]|nr:ferrous iron transport protein A [Desulfobacteraceae bacterium]